MVFLGDVEWNRKPPQVRLECDVSEELLSKLENYFYITKEVWGTHYSGKRVRIDAVLSPKDNHLWLGDCVKIGLEIKRGELSIREAATHAAQAVDYANTHWDGFGYMFIFCYPDSTQGVFENKNGFYERFLGRLGVGFLRDNCGGLELRLNEHLVWSERLGPVDARRWKLERKFGSR